MRRMKRISLFFYSCALFGAGVYGHIKYLDFFYPGLWYAAPGETAAQYGSGGNAAAQYGSYGETSVQSDGGEEAAAVSSGGQRVTPDTRLVVRIRDMDSGGEREEELPMPEKYVGMDREQFVRFIQDDPQAATLREREAGLEFLEVEAFSQERVVVTKGYRQEAEQGLFFLILEENKVAVCREDGSVWQRTDIDGRKLPGEVRNSLLTGKKLISRAELENFLVTYAAS